MTKDYELVNQGYDVAEVDSFTPNRYKQFFLHLNYSNGQQTTILDVGCNTGVGGKVLKALAPQIHLIGLDCLKRNLEKLSENIYHQNILSDSTSIPLNIGFVNLRTYGSGKVSSFLGENFPILELYGSYLCTADKPISR